MHDPETVALIDSKLKADLEPIKQKQAETGRVIDRLTTILVGDETIQHVGLIQRMKEQKAVTDAHQKFIDDFNMKSAELKGAIRVIVGVGMFLGIIGQIVVQFLVQYLTNQGGH